MDVKSHNMTVTVSATVSCGVVLVRYWSPLFLFNVSNVMRTVSPF